LNNTIPRRKPLKRLIEFSSIKIAIAKKYRELPATNDED